MTRDSGLKIHRRILMAQKLLATVSKDRKITAVGQGVVLNIFLRHKVDRVWSAHSATLKNFFNSHGKPIRPMPSLSVH